MRRFLLHKGLMYTYLDFVEAIPIRFKRVFKTFSTGIRTNDLNEFFFTPSLFSYLLDKRDKQGKDD